jgi:NAD(P)H-flavin reductase
MLEEELARGEADLPRIALLFGCRTEADVLWGEQLRSWAAAHPRFSLFITLSRCAQPSSLRAGYVQAHLREIAQEMDRPIVYACGLSRMVQEVRRVLKEELGYDRRRIRTERYD